MLLFLIANMVAVTSRANQQFGEEGAQMFKKSTFFILRFAPSLRFTLSLLSAFYTRCTIYPWSAVCSPWHLVAFFINNCRANQNIVNYSTICAYLSCIVVKLICTLFIPEQCRVCVKLGFLHRHYFTPVWKGVIGAQFQDAILNGYQAFGLGPTNLSPSRSMWFWWVEYNADHFLR